MLLSVILLRVNLVEMKIAKYRGAYKNSINEYILEVGDDISIGKLKVYDLSAEKLPMFQSTPELVYEGIKQLHKHNLNVFSSQSEEPIKVSGVYSDNWMPEYAKIMIYPNSENEQKLILSFYNPSHDIDDETVDIFINNKLVSKEIVKSGQWSVEIAVPAAKVSRIEIRTNYHQKITNGDTRPLALILDEIKLVSKTNEGMDAIGKALE